MLIAAAADAAPDRIHLSVHVNPGGGATSSSCSPRRKTDTRDLGPQRDSHGNCHNNTFCAAAGVTNSNAAFHHRTTRSNSGHESAGHNHCFGLI